MALNAGAATRSEGGSLGWEIKQIEKLARNRSTNALVNARYRPSRGLCKLAIPSLFLARRVRRSSAFAATFPSVFRARHTLLDLRGQFRTWIAEAPSKWCVSSFRYFSSRLLTSCFRNLLRWIFSLTDNWNEFQMNIFLFIYTSRYYWPDVSLQV